MMGTVKAVRTVLVCIAAMAAPSANAQEIVNGSFEAPVLPAGSFTNFLNGSTDIGGWTVVGVDSTLVNGFVQSGITFQAQDGNQWVDLAGINSNSMTSGVRQDVATSVGQRYALSFFVGSATDNQFFFPATVDLSINGGARTGFTNPTAPNDRLDWRPFTVEFTATSPKTNLTFYNGSAPDNYLGALDNVSLRAIPASVPEPSVLALLGTGLLAGGIFCRRRTRAAGSSVRATTSRVSC